MYFGRESQDALSYVHRSATGSDLFVLAQRILGADPAHRLLDDILDLSLLERGEHVWTLKKVDAEVMLERAIETSSGLANQAGVGLTCVERAGQALVQADPDRLSQIFINLLSNAIKYNVSQDPIVEVRSSLGPSSYDVVIEDNGPGINRHDRERIFEKFSRGWAQTSSDRSGAGLGARFKVSLPVLHGR